MPLFAAYMEVEEAEGVASIRPLPDRSLGLKFECSACRETGQTFVYVEEAEATDMSGGGVRNAAFKCPFCSSVISANIISWGTHTFEDEEDSEAAEAGNARDATDDGRLFTIDVRRGEPVELEMDDQWIVVARGGVEYPNADISQDWCEYDEASGDSLALLGVSITFKKVK